MAPTDDLQRRAECEWALMECIKSTIPAEAISILAHECGLNSVDVAQLINSMKEVA